MSSRFPLRAQQCAHAVRGGAGGGAEAAAQIRALAADIGLRLFQAGLHARQVVALRRLDGVHREGFPEQAERGVAVEVIGHRRHLGGEGFQLVDRAQGDPCGGLLAHGVDHHPRIAQGDDAVGLVAVGEEGAGHGLADQQGDHRMAGQPGAGVAVHRTGQRLVDAEGLLAAAVGLAGHVDHGDHRALDRRVAVGFDHLVQRAAEAPAFEQADLAAAGAREAVGGIRHHRDVTGRLAAEGGVDHAYRGRVARLLGGAGGQGAQPVQAALRKDGAHAWSPW